jgi:hypothetical protein
MEVLESMRFQITDYGDWIADYRGHEWPKEIELNKKRLAVLEKCRDFTSVGLRMWCVLEVFGFNPEAVQVKIGVRDIDKYGSIDLDEGQVIELYPDSDFHYFLLKYSRSGWNWRSKASLKENYIGWDTYE